MVLWEMGYTFCAEHEGLQEAIDKLNRLLKITPKLPKHKLATIRHTLPSSSVYAGQGPDHWLLRHWAFLPDEALRQLALIIFMMEQGAVPAQALLVYMFGLFLNQLEANDLLGLPRCYIGLPCGCVMPWLQNETTNMRDFGVML